MARSREIIKRRKSVRNIRKITKTMEMIATSKFKKTFDRAMASKPYTARIGELVGTLARAGGEIRHPLLEANAGGERRIVLVLTSNRGLCGGYNSNILHRAGQEVGRTGEEGGKAELRVSGKKGIQFFKFRQQAVEKAYTQFDDKVSYGMIEPLANEFIDLYTRQAIAGVRVVYMRFVSSARHYPEVLDLLPVTAQVAGQECEGPNKQHDEYIFSPSCAEILRELIPATVRVQLFQCFMDAAVSEQVARMSAMKAATDNAEEMGKALTRQYNRARQSQITGELLDIMGGANALKV